jgi:glycosyltransferase involved in cell wall biosynthesis
VPESAHPLVQPLSGADLALLVDRVDRFLPVTGVGAEELTAGHGVSADRVVRVAETVALGEDRPVPPPAELDQLRRTLGIDADAVVIGSFGASSVEPPSPATSLAVALRRHGSAAVLLHVAPEHASNGWARHDVECAELEDRVVVVQADDPPSPYEALCDVVVHAGWGPDHPRAYLDAAARGVPIVCFAGHELADVVGDDEAGFVCPYLDLDAMADRLAVLVEDEALRDRLGAVARDRVGVAGGWPTVADAVADLVGEGSR